MKPSKSEYPRWYDGYIDSVPEGAILKILDDSMKDIISIFKSVSEKDSLFRYDKGKWSIKELLGHLIDVERVFAYRILRISRGDSTNLNSFDHDLYVEKSNFDLIPLKNLIKEYRTLKVGNFLMLESLTENQLLLSGTVEGNEVSVRAIMYTTAGHELHHINVLKERYLPKLQGKI